MSFNVKFGLILGIVSTLLITLSFWWFTKDISNPQLVTLNIVFGIACIVVLPIGFIGMLYDMDRNEEIDKMLEDYKNLKGKRK
jgi:hypothetical protein